MRHLGISNNGDYQASFEIGRKLVKGVTGNVVMKGKAEVKLPKKFLQYQSQDQSNESVNKHWNLPDKILPCRGLLKVITKATQETSPDFIFVFWSIPIPHSKYPYMYVCIYIHICVCVCNIYI